MAGGRDRDRTCDFCRVKGARAPRVNSVGPTVTPHQPRSTTQPNRGRVVLRVALRDIVSGKSLARRWPRTMRTNMAQVGLRRIRTRHCGNRPCRTARRNPSLPWKLGLRGSLGPMRPEGIHSSAGLHSKPAPRRRPDCATGCWRTAGKRSALTTPLIEEISAARGMLSRAVDGTRPAPHDTWSTLRNSGPG
jgi:hypothetical protein